MSAAKKKVMHKELIEMNLLPWKTWRTVKRKIESEAFPAYFESGHWYFDPKEVEAWFKRKKFTSAA